MNDIATGATPEQIEAAAKRKSPNNYELLAWTWTVEDYAKVLVPPDHRIVGPDEIFRIKSLIVSVIETAHDAGYRNDDDYGVFMACRAAEQAVDAILGIGEKGGHA